MADAPRTLPESQARNLSNTTKTPPQWVGVTPRWLTQLLPWVPVEAGVYRLNRVLDDNLNIKCSPDDDEDRTLDHVRYAEKPRAGAPTPDDMDELISRVWKEPAFFLAHPRAIAAFGRECTWRGVPPPTITMFGSPFVTWRGIPLIPSDKLAVKDGKTNILLMRTGEKKRGVVGLFQPGIPGEASPSLSVRLMGINQRGAAEYLVSLYCSAAVLTDDALGVLQNVDVGTYHEYD